MTAANEATTLWVWVTAVPGGGVSQVGAYVPGMGHTILASRDRDLAEKLQPIARAHGTALGQRVWLREYRMATDHGDA